MRLRLEPDEIRFLERHETYAHATGGRTVRDLGDCLLLHSEWEREPFVNRVGAIRWPEATDAFERRLGEILGLFAMVDRRPHAWTPSDHRQPADLDDRLIDHGFVARTSAYVMVATRPAEPAVPGPGISVETWTGGPDAAIPARVIDEVAELKARTFGVDPSEVEAIALETGRALSSPRTSIVLVRDAGRPVATGQAFTFDGASYFASIGTDRAATGRGHATLVTSTLIAGARAAGSRWIHLAVRVDNERAVGVYRRCGMEIVGEAGELILGD